MAWPWAGPNSSVRRMSMSRVPWCRSMRLSVDILPEAYGSFGRMSRGTYTRPPELPTMRLVHSTTWARRRVGRLRQGDAEGPAYIIWQVSSVSESSIMRILRIEADPVLSLKGCVPPKASR